MQEQWIKIKEWWLSLAIRERKMVIIGSSVVGIFIIYQFLWLPSLQYVSLMRQRIQTNQNLLVWMQSADQEMKQFDVHRENKIISPVVLLATLQKQIKHFGLEKSLTQLKQATHETIELHFQQVEFDQLVQLLLSITSEFQIVISHATVTAENKPGIVNADLVLNFS